MWEVLASVERGGKLRTMKIDSLKSRHIREKVVTNVDRKSAFMTDEAMYSRGVGREFASHQRVNHGIHEYARGDADVNTLEGFFGIFKRGMKGVYQHCNEQHLMYYVGEFSFRYNARQITDWERTNVALKGITGRRLTYQRPRVG